MPLRAVRTSVWLRRNAGQGHVVIVVGYDAVDSAGDLGERQLVQADDGRQLFPTIDVGGDGLLVGQPGGVGLGTKGGGLISCRLPPPQEIDLKPINLVGKIGQRLVDPIGFFGDDHGVVGVAHRRGEIAAGPAQSKLSVLQVFLRCRGLEPELAARLDDLVHAAPPDARRAAVIGGLDLEADRRVGVGAGLDQVSSGGLDVGDGLSQRGLLAAARVCNAASVYGWPFGPGRAFGSMGSGGSSG